MISDEKDKINSKLIEAKKETKKFTLFRYYKRFTKMIENKH